MYKLKQKPLLSVYIYIKPKRSKYIEIELGMVKVRMLILLLLFLFSMFLVVLPNDLVPQWPDVQKLSPPGRRRPPLCSNLFALANYACAMVPFRPALPSPPATPELGYHRNERSPHGHMHSRHNHTHRYQETSEQSYCCLWLKQVDTECVCDILVRLPIFLSKPVHQYSVVVDETCTVTYSCEGRVIPWCMPMPIARQYFILIWYCALYSLCSWSISASQNSVYSLKMSPISQAIWHFQLSNKTG